MTMRFARGLWAPFVNPDAHVLIASQTVGAGGAASVTFSSIPQGYRALQIRGIAGVTTGTTGSTDMGVFFNGASANSTLYAQHRLYGNGASAVSDAITGASTYIPSMRASLNTDANSGIFGASVVDILDYANTSKNKTVRTLTGVDSNGAGLIMLNSGVWLSTAAITSITLVDGFGNTSWHQYSTFSLYGVS